MESDFVGERLVGDYTPLESDFVGERLVGDYTPLESGGCSCINSNNSYLFIGFIRTYSR